MPEREDRKLKDVEKALREQKEREERSKGGVQKDKDDSRKTNSGGPRRDDSKD